MTPDLHEATNHLRARMVDRLTASGVLTDSLLHEALLRLPREVLLRTRTSGSAARARTPSTGASFTAPTRATVRSGST
ncbi:hypothetical protein ACN6LM_001571 [Streptomyces sp. SAS_281]|uniref:hypothetical protein n=1 Tax=Streptomyces sp. SAS_281 TaxID=3412744 RepID=UPI00403CB455